MSKCRCGKVCKNSRGLKIHQTRMKCFEGEGASQRTGILPGETQETGPEAPHRARSLQVAQQVHQCRPPEKQLLRQKHSGRLACSKEEIDLHIQTTYSDPERQQELGHCNILIEPPPPVKEFDSREPLLKEVQDVVKRARSSSAPGPSEVPYKVYKNCPLLLKRLWKILKVIWRRGKVAQQWRFAEGVWIPKEEDSRRIDQFRIISLLSVEGKIFFSIVARRLADFLSNNGYIDTSVQKGGVSGVPGCLEHTGVVTQLIREARENKGDLTVLWLDLANAYGSNHGYTALKQSKTYI
ncbi:hypothetical protein SKAU_G00190090 [Synaphobranchus kaupii]|uniref:Reverse transcriptase n=1 Tax=Synaphobranchus kaupii TaxID=118154 RepID=A0A9Q1IXB6_SYNKA|nr:hypothetical protein SKAU_G00190090 [Synaphobranchus kaupii]